MLHKKTVCIQLVVVLATNQLRSWRKKWRTCQ